MTSRFLFVTLQIGGIIPFWFYIHSFLATQMQFLTRNSLTPLGGNIFLMTNIVLQLVCSVLVITRFQTLPAVGGLTLVLASQLYAYRLYKDVQFILVALSLLGGFLLLVTESLQSKQKVDSWATTLLFDKKSYLPHLLFAGRIMLLCLYFYLAFHFDEETTWLHVVMAISGLVVCLFIVLGFKAKISAALLLAFLLATSFVTKNWWDLQDRTPRRDLQKYEFFQILSVAGGFLLLSLLGPGDLSLDEKKKL